MANELPPQQSAGSNSGSDSGSGSGSGSGSDSEYDSQQENSALRLPNPSPTVSKSEPDSDSEAESSESSSAVAVKRPPENATEVQQSKKPKNAQPEDVSKKPFQRVFSEEDELHLLRGMLDFISQQKSDPIENVNDFLVFITNLKLLHFDPTRDQLRGKMRRLKGKYENIASKVKDGKERNFSKENDRETYALSKRIWGGNDVMTNWGGIKVNENVMTECGNQVEGKVGVEEESHGIGSTAVLEKWVMKGKIKNVDKGKEKELEKKWREIEEIELLLFAMRCEYMAEKARLMVAGNKE